MDCAGLGSGANLSGFLSTRCVLVDLVFSSEDVQRCVCTYKTFSKGSALKQCLIFLTRRGNLETRVAQHCGLLGGV